MDIEKLVEQLHIAGAGNPGNIFDVAADALEKLQAENEKLRVELEQVKQKYDEAREAICTHCMDFPCSGESCYWWRGQKGGLTWNALQTNASQSRRDSGKRLHARKRGS